MDMSAKCWRNVKMLKIHEKSCHFVTFCPTKTQNSSVKPVLGGELWTDPPSQRKTNLFDHKQTSEKSFGCLV